MLGMHFIKQSQGVRKKGALGRLAGTTPIASVVQQIYRSVGKGSRKTRQVDGDVLRVPAEIDEGVSRILWPSAHDHPRCRNWQCGHSRVASAGTGSWKVNKRTLKEKQYPAQPQASPRYKIAKPLDTIRKVRHIRLPSLAEF